MLVTLKDTTFDEGDYGYLDIGGGRYLAYDKEGDYFIWDKPVLLRSQPIEVAAPFGGSVEEIRGFAVDRLNSVDFLLIGVLFRSPADGYTWIAGNLVGDGVNLKFEEEGNDHRLLLPPLVFRYPKEKPSNMSKNQLLAKIAAEAEIRTQYLLDVFGLPGPDKFNFHLLIHPDSFRDQSDEDSDEDERVEGHNMEIEAHNMNQQSHVNSCWDMEKLNSSLDDCAAANCSRSRGMPWTNVWSMEQLKSSLGICATGNCSHCREVILE